MTEPQNLLKTINFANLMDLRVDFAFKLLFGGKDTRYLISLLNAIFANKGIARKIDSLTIINPHLERNEEDDKLAILDIRAQLADGTSILIEMHLYDLGEFVYKTVRSGARAFAEELAAGQNFSKQPATICIAFVNNAIRPNSNKIHSLYYIAERDDHNILTDALEWHYVNMKAFIEAMNATDTIDTTDTREVMFTKWLAIITQKDIADEAKIKELCEDEEELLMAIATLNRLSEDKITRQAYQRRRDDWLIYNDKIKRGEEAEKIAEAALAELADSKSALAVKDAEIEQLRARLAELQAPKAD